MRGIIDTHPQGGRCQSDMTFQTIGLGDHGIYSIDDKGLYKGCHCIMKPWEIIH